MTEEERDNVLPVGAGNERELQFDEQSHKHEVTEKEERSRETKLTLKDIEAYTKIISDYIENIESQLKELKVDLSRLHASQRGHKELEGSQEKIPSTRELTESCDT